MAMAERDEDAPVVRRMRVRSLPNPTSANEMYLAAIHDQLVFISDWFGALLDEITMLRTDMAMLRAAIPPGSRAAGESGASTSDTGGQLPNDPPVAERHGTRRQLRSRRQ